MSEVSRVLDSKMMDFEKRLDRQIGKAAEVVAANAAVANSHVQHPRGSSYWIHAPPAAAQPAVQYAPSQPQQSSSASEVSDALIHLILARADAAELRVSELQVSPYGNMLVAQKSSS